MNLTMKKLRDNARQARKSVGRIDTEEKFAQALPTAIVQMAKAAESEGVVNARSIAENAAAKAQAEIGSEDPGRKFRKIHHAIAKSLMREWNRMS